MKFNYYKSHLISAILLLLIACGLFIFIYLKIKSNQSETEQLKIKWQTEEIRRADLQALERSITSIDPERKELETHFVYGSNVVPFLDMIDRLAKSVGAKSEVTSLNISKEGSSLEVSGKVDGSFSSIYEFITLLENSPYELEFNSLDITKLINSDPKLDPPWSANFEIKFLSFIK